MEHKPPWAPLIALSELGPGWRILLCMELAESSLVTDFKVIPGLFRAQLFLINRPPPIYLFVCLYLSLVSLGRQQQAQSQSLSPIYPAYTHKILLSKEVHNKLCNGNLLNQGNS